MRHRRVEQWGQKDARQCLPAPGINRKGHKVQANYELRQLDCPEQRGEPGREPKRPAQTVGVLVGIDEAMGFVRQG